MAWTDGFAFPPYNVGLGRTLSWVSNRQEERSDEKSIAPAHVVSSVGARELTGSKFHWNPNYDDVSGNELSFSLVGSEETPKDAVPMMATQCAQFEPDVRKRYAVSCEPPHLLVLINKLQAVGNNPSSRLGKIVRQLDAIEGNQLLRHSGALPDYEFEARMVGGIKPFPDWFALT
jgi:hypothetical protein